MTQIKPKKISVICGYINKKGEIVIPLKFETCYPFMSKVAQVATFGGEEFLINKKGILFKDIGDIPEC